MRYEKVAEFSIRRSMKEYLFFLFTPYLKEHGAAHGFNQMVRDNPEGLIGELGFDICWVLIFSNWEGNYLQNRPKRKYRPPSKLTVEEWFTLQKRYDYRCFYCGKQGIKLTKDHILPVSKGGKDTIDNIVPACRSCNCRKGVKLYEAAEYLDSKNTRLG